MTRKPECIWDVILDLDVGGQAIAHRLLNGKEE